MNESSVVIAHSDEPNNIAATVIGLDGYRPEVPAKGTKVKVEYENDGMPVPGLVLINMICSENAGH
ncbi:MAG: hypothetical protein ABI758_02590 [Candidatus Woesebacteria bacterium]